MLFKVINLYVSITDVKQTKHGTSVYAFFSFFFLVDEVFHGINVYEPDNSLPSPPAHLRVVTYI